MVLKSLDQKKKDGAFVVLFRDNSKSEVFLVYRSDWPIWNLTGGGMEKNENPKEAAIREAFEETGFKINIVRKVGVYEFVEPRSDRHINYSHLFEGRIVSGSFVPEFPGCRGQWFPLAKLPIDTTDSTKKRIYDAAYFSGKPFTKKWCRSTLVNNLHLFFRHPIAAVKYFGRK